MYSSVAQCDATVLHGERAEFLANQIRRDKRHITNTSQKNKATANTPKASDVNRDNSKWQNYNITESLRSTSTLSNSCPTGGKEGATMPEQYKKI